MDDGLFWGCGWMTMALAYGPHGFVLERNQFKNNISVNYYLLKIKNNISVNYYLLKTHRLTLSQVIIACVSCWQSATKRARVLYMSSPQKQTTNLFVSKKRETEQAK